MGTRQIQVTGELWQQVCTVGWKGTFECIEGLPEGARFCGITYKFPLVEIDMPFSMAEYMKFPNIIIFTFEHPDWPEIEPGKEYERVLEIVWEETHDDSGA